MTANHAHTPTVDELRRIYALKVPHDQRDRRNAEFDRFLAAVEQRGADKTRVIIARKLKAEDPEAQVHLTNVGSNIYAWLWVAAQKDYIEQELPTFQNFPDRLEGDDGDVQR